MTVLLGTSSQRTFFHLTTVSPHQVIYKKKFVILQVEVSTNQLFGLKSCSF